MPAASTGSSEYAIFFRLVLPLVRPAMATVAVFTMIPIWNDLWFPLILAPGEATKTVTLGAQISSASTSPTGTPCSRRCRSPSCRCWSSTSIFSRQLIRGITAGAVK